MLLTLFFDAIFDGGNEPFERVQNVKLSTLSKLDPSEVRNLFSFLFFSSMFRQRESVYLSNTVIEMLYFARIIFPVFAVSLYSRE